MPFLEAARDRARNLPANDPMRIVLEYMLRHAVGVQNSKPWAAIQEELDDNGIRMTQTQFQQTMLAQTRAGDIFIASNDHGRARGYFLIHDRADALSMRDWYVARIAAEQTNLNNLNALIRAQWPEAAPAQPQVPPAA